MSETRDEEVRRLVARNGEQRDRAEKAERELADCKHERDFIIDGINSRLGLPEDEFRSPSPALDGIDSVVRERDKARAERRRIARVRMLLLSWQIVTRPEIDIAKDELIAALKEPDADELEAALGGGG